MKPSGEILRQRKVSSATTLVTESEGDAVENPQDGRERRGEVVWGKTPGGEVFRVPTTHDVLTTLFHPGYQKSHLDLMNLALLGLQIVLFFLLSREAAQIFFLFYFAFWRAAYDGGLGCVLTKQSKKKWIVREVQRLGWLDEKRKPAVRKWIRKQLADKMGKDYSFDDLPLEYNTWLLFRQVVDVILVNDFLSYCMFAFSCFRVPESLSTAVHAMRWLGGIALISFNIWVKTEAHNVVKDYGWYWGDVFFQRGALVFDGVFELAPHPMYSVGYAGYYGLSLISGSYAVLFASLAAHAAQFAFLVFFENPHIERMYGKPKAIAKRTPLLPPGSNNEDNAKCFSNKGLSKLKRHQPNLSTESATSSNGHVEYGTSTSTQNASIRPGSTREGAPTKSKALSQHDLLNKYFRRDAVVLRNVDLLRASDVMLVLIIFYGLTLTLLPTLSPTGTVVLHFCHALAWCIIHYFGLGLLLRAQSKSKFLVGHYLKNYHYSMDDGGQSAIIEAFANWKAIYNLSMCMTYVSCIGIVWKSYLTPHDWTVGNELLCHTLGALLIGLHIWATMESYKVLGLFGWFFGDFFMEEFPAHLEYSGIYRYLNNPEAMGGAAYFGLALISGSKLVLSLAVIRHLANWWFLSCVEHPHMRKLYGNSLRKDAGFVKVMKSVASKNAQILESRAGRHAPDLKRVAKEVIGTFDKVYEETADAVEEFLARSAPRISEVVQDTRILLQQSRERLIIARVASDLSSYDTSKYRVSVIPSSSGGLRFHLGEPVTVEWQAPQKHSRKDWIGLYRVGANKSREVTTTNAIGMWLPVHDEEWDGDMPLDLTRASSPHCDADMGTITFKANSLPWLVGRYEVRYHHDGKHNVMSMEGPFEIYVDKPSEFDLVSVRKSLMRIVPLCLDSDPSLIPLSCKVTETPLKINAPSDTTPDPTNIEEYRADDFTFWSEQQAKRMSAAIKQIFDVEYAPEVIVADANLMALAKRILVSKEILSFGPIA